MQVLITGLMLAVMAAGAAMAQGGSPPASKSFAAPVGHRQPSAKTLPGVTSSTDPKYSTSPELDQREQDLKRRLQNICRGC